MAGEEGALGERAAHRFAAHAVDGEGDGRRAREGGRGAVQADAADRGETVPETRGEASPFVVQRIPIERLEKGDRRGDAGDAFLILRAGLGALGPFARRGIERRKRQRLEQLTPRVEDAGVRAVELVRRAGQEIAADALHVDELVRREVDGVDEEQRARLARDGRREREVVHRPRRVRRAADRDQLRPRRDELPQVLPVDLRCLADHPRRAHDDAAVDLQRPPRRHVGVMIEVGHDHLVSLGPCASEGAREVKRERRHVRAEDDFVRRAIQEVAHGLARRGDDRVALDARRIRPVRVRIVVEEIVVHRLGDDARHLRPARRIEVGDGIPPVDSLERGELTADVLHGPRILTEA